VLKQSGIGTFSHLASEDVRRIFAQKVVEAGWRRARDCLNGEQPAAATANKHGTVQHARRPRDRERLAGNKGVANVHAALFGE
jgi:hypothetical protein